MNHVLQTCFSISYDHGTLIELKNLIDCVNHTENVRGSQPWIKFFHVSIVKSILIKRFCVIFITHVYDNNILRPHRQISNSKVQGIIFILKTY